MEKVAIGYHTFPSGKQYTYILTPDPVFLRNIIFLKNTTNPREVAIVHEWGMRKKGRCEPPKGQMEWKELNDTGIKFGDKLTWTQLYRHMKKGVLREMQEEANVLSSEIRDFHRLRHCYQQAWPESGIPGAQFMYQFWEAKMTPAIMLEAQKRIQTLVENEDWKRILPSDITEKDAIQWWKPEDGWDIIRGGFSKKMTALYFQM
jgi:hypothetical protein